MDPLHTQLRTCIRQAWKNLAGQQAFKNVVINEDMRKWFPKEFSTEKQITNRMSCGESANRLCQILTGSTLGDITTNANSVDLANGTRVGQALQAMTKMPGYILVRINIIGGGAGHAYIFLSVSRAINDPLLGHIYQTNVGVHHETAFGLKQWIDDPKSSRVVELADHLEELRHLCGTTGSSNKLPSLVYGKQFMLSSKPLKFSDLLDLNKVLVQGKRAKTKFLWTPMNKSVFTKNLIRIRDFGRQNQIKR